MRTPLIAGNWKMHNTLAESLSLVKGIMEKAARVKKTEIAVAPPFTALSAVASLLQGSSIQLSSQNLFWEEKGAYTGEISPAMIADLGCRYAIIGHSERRQYFWETDATVNKRTKAALSHGIRPIVCIGETLEERDAGKTLAVNETQLKGALEGIDAKGMEAIVIAYEPVWAIGTGRNATPEQAEEVHLHIRNTLGKLYGAGPSQQTRILCGGSMKPDNARELLRQPDIDGGLVGGAGLKAESFTEIILAAEDLSL